MATSRVRKSTQSGIKSIKGEQYESSKNTRYTLTEKHGKYAEVLGSYRQSQRGSGKTKVRRWTQKHHISEETKNGST